MLITFSIGVICSDFYRAEKVRLSQETVLRENLFQIRREVDRYTAYKGGLPESLDELVRAGYLREVPLDPITGQNDWTIVMGNDPYSSEERQGIKDVKSTSPAKSSEGKPYSDW
jgi:general secretion pathway protein G